MTEGRNTTADGNWRSSARSPSALVRAYKLGDFREAPMAEIWTIFSTPFRAAILPIRPGNSACNVSNFWRPDGAKIPIRFTTISAGSIIAAKSSSFSALPATALIWPTAPKTFRLFARSVLRARIKMRAPVAASFSTIARPTKPVPPITAIVFCDRSKPIYPPIMPRRDISHFR